ncbi:MAG: hypothetical protein JW915_02555 [Chitinispirillaceae bacterium]|nr:hypothetical protein [Chitinispirillaceae bacterium]
MKKISLYILVLSINLLLFQCGGDGPLVTTGGSEVWGKVTNVNGSGVSGVSVKLYQIFGEDLNDSAVEITTTDKNGIYRFKDPDAGLYVILGQDTRSGEVFLRRGIQYESGKVEYNDVLKTAGMLLVIFKGADVILDGVAGFIPGTPYFNFIENDSLLIAGMAQGRYVCKSALQTLDFLPVVTDTFNIEPGMQTIIEVNLEKNPNADLPVPKNLTLEKIVDTLAGRAILKWDPVNVSDLKGYILYRGMHSDSITTNVATTTFAFDTISLVIDTTGIPVDNYFQVKAVDTLGNHSGGSNFITVPAPSPLIVKTVVSDTLIAPHGKLYIGDTVAIVVTVKNVGRLVDSIIWAVERPDSVVTKKAIGGVHQYIDTMKFVWEDSLAKTWYITAIDNSGASVTMVERVTSSCMYLPDTWEVFPHGLVNAEQALTAVSDGIHIFIFGGFHDVRHPISGKIRQLASDSVKYFSPESFNGFHSAKMSSVRDNHSSVLYNGKIYSIGGRNASETFSTIEVFDCVTHQSTIVDTLPYVRYGASVSVSGTKFYISGGTVKMDSARPDEEYVTSSVDIFDVSLLDIGQNPLSHFANLLVPRYSHTTVICDNKLIVMGGFDTLTYSSISHVESIDLTSGMKSQLPQMKDKRCNFSAVAVSDNVYVFGGYDQQKGLSSVEVLEIKKSSEWKYVCPMTKARYGMSAALHNGVVYLIGGISDDSDINTNADSTITVYYP